MSSQIDDIRIAGVRSLVAPEVLMGELALGSAESDFIAGSRAAVEAIFKGGDDRLVVVVGPCSIHDSAAAIEYAERLKPLADALAEDLAVVMRVYFEKPRTTVGWKGFINDPFLDGSFNINRGLHLARSLLVRLAEMGLAAGTEFLDTISPQYIADAVSWGAIGARTTESQVHRQLASGLSMPVGFKNGTDGNVQIAIDAIGAAKGPHHFLSVTKQGVSAIVETKGNDACHVILRGATTGPNYHEESVVDVLGQLLKAGLDPYLMVDCSHGNSLKDYRRQPGVAEDVGRQLSAGQRGIAGVMLESNLIEGAQKVGAGERPAPGQSITDACMGWETTVGVLHGLAAAVRERRKRV